MIIAGILEILNDREPMKANQMVQLLSEKFGCRIKVIKLCRILSSDLRGKAILLMPSNYVVLASMDEENQKRLAMKTDEKRRPIFRSGSSGVSNRSWGGNRWGGDNEPG